LVGIGLGIFLKKEMMVIMKLQQEELCRKVMGKRKVKSEYDGKIREVVDLIKEL